MFWREYRTLVVGCLFFMVLVSLYLAWRGWHGYLFPIRYVKYNEDGGVWVEGYRQRLGIFDGEDDWRKEGKWISYYETGAKMWEGRYHKSRQVGVWTHWNRDGSIEYVDERDEDGLSLRCIRYENGAPKIEKDDPDSPRRANPSGTHWDDDPERREEIERAFQRKLREGVPRDKAGEVIAQEYHLKWARVNAGTQPAPAKAESKP